MTLTPERQSELLAAFNRVVNDIEEGVSPLETGSLQAASRLLAPGHAPSGATLTPERLDELEELIAEPTGPRSLPEIVDQVHGAAVAFLDADTQCALIAAARRGMELEAVLREARAEIETLQSMLTKLKEEAP